MGIIVQLPPFGRDAAIRSASFSDADNSVEVVWTTGAVVRRLDWRTETYYDEELVVSHSAVRLDRLNSGAPFLDTHNDGALTSVIGTVVPGSAVVQGGKGIARIALSVASNHQGIVANIKAGVIRSVSVGYRNHRIEKSEPGENGVALWRVVDWEPLEISAVPIPADAGSMIRTGMRTDDDTTLAPCEFVGGRIDHVEAARIRMRLRG